MGTWHQDIGRLEYRVAQEAKGELLLIDIRIACHILDAGQTSEARNGDEHLKDQIDLVDLFDCRLDVEGYLLRVNTHRKMVKHKVTDILGDLRNIITGRLGRQDVEVGNNKETFVALLEGYPIRK
jgi:hypothetical protein